MFIEHVSLKLQEHSELSSWEIRMFKPTREESLMERIMGDFHPLKVPPHPAASDPSPIATLFI